MKKYIWLLLLSLLLMAIVIGGADATKTFKLKDFELLPETGFEKNKTPVGYVYWL